MNTTGMPDYEIFGRACRRLGYGSGPAWDSTNQASIDRWIIENIHPQLRPVREPLAYCGIFGQSGYTAKDDAAACSDAAACAGNQLSARGGSESAIAYLTRFVEWEESQ
jgi:hypothetical protein